MMPTDAEYYFTRASIPRELDEHEVKRIAAEYGLKGECYGSVKDAFTAAKASASKDDTIFVGGSTFVVADILSFNS